MKVTGAGIGGTRKPTPRKTVSKPVVKPKKTSIKGVGAKGRLGADNGSKAQAKKTVKAIFDLAAKHPKPAAKLDEMAQAKKYVTKVYKNPSDAAKKVVKKGKK